MIDIIILTIAKGDKNMYDVIENVKIEDMIYEIRGVQVILDSDLAKLYDCANGTKTINQAVKRNKEKFPDDFYFQLTLNEFNNLKSQNGTSSSNRYGGVRKLPYVFTEIGVSMLSTVIHTGVATQTTINIMRAFVTMRHLIIENKDIYKSLSNINNKLINQENKINDNTDKINYLFTRFDKKEQLFLENQTYTAYRSILEILNSAIDNIIIIDEYADISLLDLIRTIKCDITLITRDSNRLSNIEIEKYNKEYNNLTVFRNNSFHDRFFIIDRNDIYLSGSSINSAGNKTFMIIKIEKESVKNTILKDIDKIIDKK